jgi:hypothetical protein
MIAVRVLLQGFGEVSQGSVGIPGVERDSCRVDALRGRLRAGRATGGLAFADLQIQPGPLDKLTLVRVLLNDVPEAVCCDAKIMTL